MEWYSIKTKDDGSVEVPGTWLLPHYYEALNVLFRIENALRVFVYVVLKNEFKENWLAMNVASDDAEETTIAKIAKQRMNQAKAYGYLGYPIPCPLMYMTSGELIRLMTSDSCWKHFKDYFLGNKEIIKTKLDEIGTVRNALAHFRPLKPDDVELIKQNARHVMLRVESSLTDLMRCPSVVPTNTQDEWYKQLRTLGTDICSMSFHQSESAFWVKVTFEYRCPILSPSHRKTMRRYRVLNIDTAAILPLYPDLANTVIYLSEQLPYTSMTDDDVPKFQKDISMVFSRDILISKSEQIKSEFEKFLLKISEETGLLQEDNLARGDLVHAVNVTARWNQHEGKQTGNWSFEKQNLIREVRENDPPEYWGALRYVEDNYVTSTDDYPWMPVSVCELVPF